MAQRDGCPSQAARGVAGVEVKKIQTHTLSLALKLNRDWCDYSCNTGVWRNSIYEGNLTCDTLPVQDKRGAIGPFEGGGIVR